MLAAAALCLLLAATTPEAVDAADVAPVWAGHPVGFHLLTHGDQQFVAYYDDQRRMTVAQRRLAGDEGPSEWSYTVLPESVGWDSHNGIVMAVDGQDFLHLSGNMHGHKLVYFRSTRPLDASSLERVERMTGDLESRVTYPVFLRDHGDRLLFTYRDGGSGSGNQIYNAYDLESKRWTRLIDRPLLDGEGARNAYPMLPVRGNDGWFHLVWVWRDTPDCATNHSPSYARSSDLVNWTTWAGDPLELPITLGADGVIVDPVPAGGGVINGNVRVGFGLNDQVIVTYHKHDEAGCTQVYNARLTDAGWDIRRTSDWNYRWEFSGGGSIPFEIRVSAVRVDGDGRLVQPFSHAKFGSGVWVLDPDTLAVTATEPAPPGYPPELTQPESDFSGMQVRWTSDAGTSPDPRVRYVLRWETLGPNRDHPRPEPWPEPSMLRVYALTR